MHAQNDKKFLSFIDVIVMTITANFGIRWLAVAAGIGPSSMVFWLVGALFFFLPLAIISSQLAKLYPEEGGIYIWTKNTLGEKSGFMVAWFYWVNNIFFYPAILIFLASNFAYFLNKPELANDTTFITLTVLCTFWLVVFVALLGLKISKYLITIGGILGSIIPVLILITFALIAFFKFGGSATSFASKNFIPNNKILDNLSSLSIIMFAMAGVEVIPTFANSVKNVKRDLYFGLLIGSLLLFLFYTLGTLSMNVIDTPESIRKASGLIESFKVIDIKFHIQWFTRTIAFFLIFAELAAITVWLIAPVIMLFKCTPIGILPNFLHKTNKSGTPVAAIFFQGFIISIVVIMTNLLPNVNLMYQALIIMATVLYFIPYLFVVFAYIKAANLMKKNKKITYLLSYGVLISTIFGILISFTPTADLKNLHDIMIYELELIAGPLLFILVGDLLYRFRKKVI